MGRGYPGYWGGSPGYHSNDFYSNNYYRGYGREPERGLFGGYAPAHDAWGASPAAGPVMVAAVTSAAEVVVVMAAKRAWRDKAMVRPIERDRRSMTAARGGVPHRRSRQT